MLDMYPRSGLNLGQIMKFISDTRPLGYPIPPCYFPVLLSPDSPQKEHVFLYSAVLCIRVSWGSNRL